MEIHRRMLKAKIHRATVTDADLEYEGSLTIPPELLEQADIKEHEAIQIWNVTRGTRFETYAMTGVPGSGEICVNGAAAHLAEVGHKVIIASYGIFAEAEIPGFAPRIALVDADNRITKLT